MATRETTYAENDGRSVRTVDDGRARLLRTLGLVVGATFLIVGILGFIPGITTHVDQMDFAGHESGSELFGIFHVSVLHNLVHLLFGVVGLAASRTARGAKLFLLIGGVIYLVLALYGAVIDMNDSVNFVPVDDEDNWLHLGLGIGMIALGLIPLTQRRRTDDLADTRTGRARA
jgi:hypothetical protein